MQESVAPSELPEPKASGLLGPARSVSGLRRSFIDALAWLIVVAWAASFIVDMIVPTYDPPASIHALMLTVAGSAFATSFIKRPEDKVAS